MFHNVVTMQHTEHLRFSRGPLSETEEIAPEHPSVQALVGSQDSDILKVVEQIYRIEDQVAPSVFTHVDQEDFMRELQ